MLSNEDVSQVATALGRLVAGLGSRSFGATLLDFMATQARFDSALLVSYHEQRRPVVLAEALTHALRRNSADAYVAGAYLLDPFFQCARAITGARLVRLADIVPADFLQSEYFLSYYKDSHVVDEINYLVPVGDGNVIAVCLERSGSQLAFSDAEVRRFRDWLPLVSALAGRHWVLGGNAGAGPGDGAHRDHEHDRLQALLHEFARERLTPREHEIVQLMLTGQSTPRIATDLRVSAETVRVHRRNIYEKLDISSLGELFTLAMRTLLAGRQ